MRGNRKIEKPTNFRKSIKNLIDYSKKYHKVIIISIILAITSSVITIIAPNKTSELIDVIGKTSEINFDKVKSLSIMLLAIYFISSLISLIQSLLMADASNKLSKDLRENISNKINKLPLKYFDENEYGDVLSRITNDVDTINQSFQNSIVSLVSSSVLLIAATFMMYYTNAIMATVAIITTLGGFALMFFLINISQKYFNKRQKALGDLTGYIEEAYSNHTIVKVYNGKEESLEKFNKLNFREYSANLKSQFISGIMQPLMHFSGDLSYIAVCITGALLVKNNVISFGVIVAFIMYIRIYSGPLRQIATGLGQLQSAAAASERVFEFLNEKEMPKETKHDIINPKTTLGTVEFKNVKFGYNKDKLIINDFSAKIKAGSKVAIVGPTGAGKTTLVNLLMKFYDITSGDILIDGKSIKNIKRKNIHDLFIMVLQDTWLFEGTIRENIVYNNKNIKDEKVEEICKVIGLDHFIKTLNKGLNYKIKDDESISAGQKQLITIARGMIKDAPLLILDEATSNVDTRTEELVQKAMDKLTEGRTSFIIAHRLSTIKNADLILVIDKGNIIEKGTHKELINKNGFYANLYNSQFTKIK
ncbi:MAG TPA: ABC transporter ATP-binding protein [Mollicutes bacterium]|nr:ABC transporter ATP-binding protein [Mollicutes bacterium]